MAILESSAQEKAKASNHHQDAIVTAHNRGLTPARRKLTVEPERLKNADARLLLELPSAAHADPGGCGLWSRNRHRFLVHRAPSQHSAKLASYECGIPAEGDARGRFSVRFYMVAMLFILFDVEAVFMLPWAVIYRELPKLVGSRMFGFWEMVVYLGFVMVGFFYVSKKGILDWSSDKADL